MCACCHSCCRGGCCFASRCQTEKLLVLTEPLICMPRKREKCECHRNRCLLVALAYLFRCTNLSMLSTLWHMAYRQGQPLRGFARDPAWRVLQRVKAPYTEVHDLEIYDSLYDRCGIAIDPLDPCNMFKVLRLMFLSAALVPEQRMGLMRMLEKLNELAFRRVNLELLLQTLASINIEEFVYSLAHHHNLNAYQTKLSEELSQLYERVVTTDKNAIIRYRNRLARGATDINVEPVKTAFKSRNSLNYCIPRSREVDSLSPSGGCVRYAHGDRQKRRKNNSSGIMQSDRKGTDP
ncbi:uncharacterized protein LOC117584134 [Drosophila guanche]|uniref:Uncharacterized protein n=1 Tax=Drosophila guanche TaxID=7266 RepID=A0A3B0JPC6_DROGU|nr:uncharacterized protein LOC117584134 [Drosophila guanche]SPP82212.1 Hypothetical predicted protein [Drosophila guanche]